MSVKHKAKENASSFALPARQRKESFRSAAGRSALNARQKYMLSYLNRAQRQQWDKYSPIQQRKIMEEIEKKLERKLPGDVAPAPEKISAFDVGAYADEEKAPYGYRIRGHPGDGKIRLKQEETLRQGISILRVSPVRSMMQLDGQEGRIKKRCLEDKSALKGKAIAVRRAAPSKAANAADQKSRSGDQIHAGGGQETRKSLKAIRGPALQQRIRGQALPGEKKDQPFGEQHFGAASGGSKNAGQKGAAAHRSQKLIRYAAHAKSFERRGESRLSGQIKDKDPVYPASGRSRRDERTFPFQAGRETAIDHISRRERQEKSILRTVPSDDALEIRKTDTDMKIRKTEETIRDKNDPLRDAPVLNQRYVSGEKAEGAAQKEEASLRKSGEKEAGKEAVRRAAKAAETESAAKSMPPDVSAQWEPEAKRSVILQKKQAQKEIFRSLALSKQKAERSSLKENRRLARRDKKREAKYQKEFASLLIATIEKDMAKQANIRQAQKSGQISATVSELTGETGRSTLRAAALPLRLHLAFLGKKLRAELKRRMKEAVRNLMRHAAVFGAPVFAVVIIVMLLASICMISTTQNEPRGTGLGFRIVQEAKKHLGLPYVYGGTSLVDGCDCSGFVWAIYNIFGYNLPRTAGDQYAYGRKVGSNVSDWQMGDLIYYSKTGSVQSGGGRAEHIVIYIGGGQVISCGPVAIYNWDYRSDYCGTCRIIPDEPLGGDFSGSTNEEICWNYFISQGFSEAATAGILGNMYVESGGTFDPSIHQYGGGPGRGLCQWEESYSGGSGRYNNLVAFANGLGKSWDDITAQLQFVSYELDSGAMNPYFAKFGGVEAFKNSTDPATATYVFLCGFEYCGDPGQSFLESAFSLSTRVDHAGWAYLNYQ